MTKLHILLISWLLTMTNVQIAISNSPTDTPDISVDSDSLNFGQVFIGDSVSLELVVRNNGSQDLLISSAVTQPTAYNVSPGFAGINPNDIEIFTVTISPQDIDNYPVH